MKYIWKQWVAMACLCCCMVPLFAQMSPVQTVQLKKLAAQLQEEYQAERQRTIEKAQQLGLPLEIRNPDRVMILDHFVNNEPIYIGYNNEESQESISADLVKTGGGLGLNLTGAGQTLGIWEAGGAVRTTHQELTGRATQMDGATTLSNHAAHVAGTMIAAGVDPDEGAEGFSSGANLICFDSGNDDAEMAAAAIAPTPIRISNHSYGSFAGWDQDNMTNIWEWWGAPASTDDWKLGAYDALAQNWDNLAFTAPFYLIVKAAGNDRNDFGPAAGVMHAHGNGPATETDFHSTDGTAAGYDCIPTDGNAKNILTVGAVNKIFGGYNGPASVTSAAFSSWGPTDDGRVKPDVVAAGVGLNSSFSASDQAYGILGGTSMASPSVSGGAGLLLEHWGNVLTGTPRATTMKGLLIHQADECGTAVGPDYSFGWGLVNIADAAELITIEGYDGCQQYIETSVAAGEIFEYVVHSSGLRPLKVTLVWNDPASGTVNNGTINPAGSNLVNNLDLRLVGATTTLPWTLDPNNPAAAAVRADNNRDNVEQIIRPNPTSGAYTIRVIAPATLTSGPQAFTLWFSGNDATAADRTISGVTYNDNQTISVRNNLVLGPNVMVVTPANVRTYAGNSIRMVPGFHATAGSRFVAKILPGGGCGEFSGLLKADNPAQIMDQDQTSEERQAAANTSSSPAGLEWNLSPNPSTDFIKVDFDIEHAQFIQFQLFTQEGRLLRVLQEKQWFEKGACSQTFQLQDIPAGAYFVQMETANERSAKPFLIQK